MVAFIQQLVQTLLNDGGLRLAYSVVFLAGISEGFGTQSAVLFVNRVSRRNFALNLLFSGGLALFGALAWILSVWLIYHYVFTVLQPLALIARLVMVGYLPLLLGFLIIIPYLGPGIGVCLHVASFIIVVLAMQLQLSLPLPVVLGATIGGWLFIQLLRLITSRPLAVVDRFLWRIFTGSNQKLDLNEIPLVLADYNAGPPSREQH